MLLFAVEVVVGVGDGERMDYGSGWMSRLGGWTGGWMGVEVDARSEVVVGGVVDGAKCKGEKGGREDCDGGGEGDGEVGGQGGVCRCGVVGGCVVCGMDDLIGELFFWT